MRAHRRHVERHRDDRPCKPTASSSQRQSLSTRPKTHGKLHQRTLGSTVPPAPPGPPPKALTTARGNAVRNDTIPPPCRPPAVALASTAPVGGSGFSVSADAIVTGNNKLPPPPSQEVLRDLGSNLYFRVDFLPQLPGTRRQRASPTGLHGGPVASVGSHKLRKGVEVCRAAVRRLKRGVWCVTWCNGSCDCRSPVSPCNVVNGIPGPRAKPTERQSRC